jgi:DNA polymerase (family X)
VTVPFLLRRLRELNVIDDAGAQALDRDGIVTLADLELAIAEQRPAVSARPFASAAESLGMERRPMTLGRAWDVASVLIQALENRGIVDALQPAGHVRRSEPLVPALTIVGRAADPTRAIQAIAELPYAFEVVYRTTRRIVLHFEGHEVDLRVCPPDEYGTLLFVATGPAAHVAEIQKVRGRRLAASEADIYTHAGLAWLPPEVRDAPDAIDRARNGAVPPLVERGDIRGDLHMHTTYSDGRDTVRQMVQASRAAGYEYIAITDHSEHAGASRTLQLDDLHRQRDEVERLRQQFPDMTILHGIEVDIMPDGSLDCPDVVLAGLDIVLASLHDGAGHDRRKLTNRCLAAIRHPLVSVITHPANQLVGRREGYDMDFDAVYAAAAETGTALEVDGAPSHLDLSGERARDAVAAGVTLVIDSDCHRSPALDRQMRMGVGTARRGWVEARHVLNTRPIADVRTFLARKRAT